jgi:hypothetical protein
MTIEETHIILSRITPIYGNVKLKHIFSECFWIWVYDDDKIIMSMLKDYYYTYSTVKLITILIRFLRAFCECWNWVKFETLAFELANWTDFFDLSCSG